MNFEEKEKLDREILINSIKKQFNGSLRLKKSQASILLNRSIPSLDRDRANSRGPSFKKDFNGNVYYPINALVDYLLKMEHTMDSSYE